MMMNKDEQISGEFIEEFKKKNSEMFEKISDIEGMDKDEYAKEIAENPRRWFPIKIERLFNRGFDRMGIIASNVYAESTVDFWVHNLNEIRRGKNQISKTESKKFSTYSYADKLDIFRELDIMTDTTYGTLKRLNKARNNFAHNLDSHHPDNTSEIEKEMSTEEILDVVDSLYVELQEGFTEWASEVTSGN